MTLLGTATAAVVLILLLSFERYTADLGTVARVHDFVLLFVLPVPAIVLSCLACSGYYLGARITHYRPGKIVLANVLLFTAILFVAVYWLEFIFVFQPFRLVDSNAGFNEFFHKVIFESDITLTTKSGRGGRQVESSWASVAMSLLIFAGYLFGGLALYEAIRHLPYCHACGQFMNTRRKQVRYPAGQQALKTTIKYMQALLDNFNADELHAMLNHHGSQARERSLKERYWRSILWHKECTGCDADCIEHQAYRFGRSGWTTHGDKLQVFPHGQIELEL